MVVILSSRRKFVLVVFLHEYALGLRISLEKDDDSDDIINR